MAKESIKKLMNLPVAKNGYVSSSIRENSDKYRKSRSWHMKHKPYACDCPPSHSRRG